VEEDNKVVALIDIGVAVEYTIVAVEHTAFEFDLVGKYLVRLDWDEGRTDLLDIH